MPHTRFKSPGHYLAFELFAAKARGDTLTQSIVGDRFDVLLEQWNQTAPAAAVPATTADSKTRLVVPPSPADVTAYFLSIGYPVSGDEFCDSYQQKGWVVGKAKMKDWQSACRNWKRNGWGKPIGPITGTQGKDYTRL